VTAGRPKKKTLGLVDLRSTEDKLAAIRVVWYAGLKVEALLDLDDWADAEVYLPKETSSEWGPWRTSRFPFIRKIMKALSPRSKAKEVIVMKGAQLAITSLATCWILYKPACHPGPMMYLQKTDDAAANYSNQKLVTSIRDCEAVYHTLGAGRPGGYASRWDFKAYPGGYIMLNGANSTATLRGSSIGDAVADEEDSYELDIGHEGSPVDLLKKRMVNFPNRKLLRISTPVLKELSTIEPAWEVGSQERFYLPCPQCNPGGKDTGFLFWLRWDHIQWGDEIDPITGYPVEVWVECPNCAGKIEEAKHKTWMLDRGDWFSEKAGKGRERVGDVEKPSFHISSLYSPYGFFSWSDAVHEWFDYLATRDTAKLQVFINQTLAETYHLQGSEISYGYLAARREAYAGNLGDFRCPDGVLCLTAGADVQDDRIEVEVVGWGQLDENWSIDYQVIMGDTGILGDRYLMLPDGRPSVWRLLDEYLFTRFRHECGVEMVIEMAMIDAGHKTEEVHTFCRQRESRRIWPIKGEAGWGKGLYRSDRRRHERFGTWLFHSHVDEVKTKVYSQLVIDRPGPGFCHFPKLPQYSDKYFQGLTCERRKTKMSAGRMVMYWDTPSGARNEPLDCRVMNIVAINAYPVNLAARAAAGLSKVFGERPVSDARPRRRVASKGI
jgi:phage terminase large subunit GpA-like protein